MRLNRTMIIPIDPQNAETVLGILSEPILAQIKPNILKELLEYENGVGSLDSIKDSITTQQLKDLLALVIVVDRVWYWLELKPALISVNVPALFPKRTIATEWDEEGNPTASRVLKINEYFHNETMDDRFFIRLAKAPIDSHGGIRVDDLPNSQEIASVIAEFGNNILNHYSPAAWRELKSELIITE